MRILMIAPEPFFQPRGTPFSEYYRARAFTELGHHVDMVTYPLGDDVSLPGLRIFRAVKIPGIRKIPIGPSLAKVPLDAAVFLAALRRLMVTRYDLVDGHEEGGLMGVFLGRLFGVPALYDMHSSLPEQLANFRYSHSPGLRRLFELFERWTVRGSKAIIVICPYLGEVVARIDADRPRFLIENSPLAETGRSPDEREVTTLRRSLGLQDGSVVVLYTGTFEAYQGLELLLDAMIRVVREEPRARLLLVGGHAEQVRAAKAQAQERGLSERVRFTGQLPPSEMPLYLAAGDVLVSPRSTGSNTPLKIYSYLRAGKPIVATRLLTHTQVLDDEVAMLTAPEPDAFAGGILTTIRDEEEARRRGENARRRAEELYSYDAYLERTRRVLEFFEGPTVSEVVESRAASS